MSARVLDVCCTREWRDVNSYNSGFGVGLPVPEATFEKLGPMTFPPQMVNEILRVYVRMHGRMWYRFPRNSYLTVYTAFALRGLLHFRRQSERERLARQSQSQSQSLMH